MHYTNQLQLIIIDLAFALIYADGNINHQAKNTGRVAKPCIALNLAFIAILIAQ